MPHCREWRIRCANREWSSRQVPYLQLTLKDKILLAALLLTHVDDVAGVTQTHEVGAFAPSLDSTQVFIDELWSSGVIVLTTAPDWVTTNLRTEWIYMSEEYGWSGNVSCESGEEKILPASKLLHQLLDDLCSGLEASDEATLVAMISELAEDYALAYIETQMDKQNLDLTSKSATRKVVQSLMEELPLADVCAIGWQAVKYCGNAYRDKIANNRRHAANMLPGIMAKIADTRKLKQDPWKVQRGIKTVSRIERILHDLLFEGHDTFFNLPLNRYCEEVVKPRFRQ
ncbi:hypothetical protein OH708_00810 [Pseudomonas capsici]|uniref:hypothetical protein n=1 Tax=Pseudomonas capsici TaxID=2810614 RepID=UPI0021F0CDB9|nr:hypothetical protein [Pseudomonas capsici]MCV4286435.1 hypothetical protein [Pseudomonas capsici]